MKDDLIERMARVICAAAGHVNDRHWEHYTPAAQAAAAAMFDYLNERAGEDAVLDAALLEYEGDYALANKVLRDGMEGAIKAMLQAMRGDDHALKEPTP